MQKKTSRLLQMFYSERTQTGNVTSCGWKVTEYIYSVTVRFEVLVHHQKHAAESAVCDVTELLSCDWTGEDATAGGDRVIHDRDVDWLRQSDGDY